MYCEYGLNTYTYTIYGSTYRSNYQTGYESHNTQESCELKIQGEKSYCPNNPDNVACVEFLHNATNKRPAQTGICAGKGDPKNGLSALKRQIQKDTASAGNIRNADGHNFDDNNDKVAISISNDCNNLADV